MSAKHVATHRERKDLPAGPPNGLCPDREEHVPHWYDSKTLGRFWCTADQSTREPGRSERVRRGRA